ncbi:hypothetical protein [Pedobacter montanisoli]|uniref:DUF2975 domain-containing protein n=1 Tax=Pedobacter montanisoli TaxID=2923277 RepID=A0ABT0A002_9SPHI|nr:hypothetical protein [Pedobacter montanisoli]MCJ0743905.1 hypothetical protein [Pedobacter montanisoli]
MTIRTFWTIFIKILGIWLILGSITVIPQFLSVFYYTYSNNNTIQDIALTIVLLLLTISVYILILRLLVFKTDWIIDKLRLDKGFNEEEINLNIQLQTILRIAIIVIGGIMCIDSLPQLCQQIFVFFQQKNVFGESPSSGWIIFHFIKGLIGYLLMTNSRSIVAFIDKQSTKQN